MRTRSFRRHQLSLKKRDAKKIYPHSTNSSKWANHLKVCSCWMCGNARKHFGELTMQERKANNE